MTTQLHLTPQTRVTFSKLRFGHEITAQGDYAILRWDTDRAISANLDAIKTIFVLMEGKTIAQTAHILSLSVGNVTDIVRLCLSSGFIVQVNSTMVAQNHPKIKPWLTKLPKRYFSWVLSPIVLACAFVFAISGLYLAVSHPNYLPKFTDFFWTDNLLSVLLSSELMGLVFLFAHEVVHFIATKAVGGEGNMRISHRFLDLVVETNHFHLAVIPKGDRYLVYLSGMLLDICLISGVFWLYQLSDIFGLHLGLIRSLLPVFLLGQLTSFAWEFSAYLESDIYNFLADFLHQDNLYADTKKFILSKIPSSNSATKFTHRLVQNMLFGANSAPANDLRYLTKTDKHQFTFYALFLCAGLIFNALIFIFITLPLSIWFLSLTFQDLYLAFIKSNPGWFVQSFLVLLLISYSDILLFGIIIRKLLRHESII